MDVGGRGFAPRLRDARCPGVGDFSIADDAGFVKLFRRDNFRTAGFFHSGKSLVVTLRSDLAPLLRRVVFIGEAALGAGQAAARAGTIWVRLH